LKAVPDAIFEEAGEGYLTLMAVPVRLKIANSKNQKMKL
jgi:hypothetical protein